MISVLVLMFVYALIGTRQQSAKRFIPASSILFKSQHFLPVQKYGVFKTQFRTTTHRRRMRTSILWRHAGFHRELPFIPFIKWSSAETHTSEQST